MLETTKTMATRDRDRCTGQPSRRRFSSCLGRSGLLFVSSMPSTSSMTASPERSLVSRSSLSYIVYLGFADPPPCESVLREDRVHQLLTEGSQSG